MRRQLLSTSYSCAICVGVWMIIVEYGFCSQMAGTPRGRQLTDDFESSSSVGVIDLILASAHSWSCGRSSGVTFGSNCPRAAGSTPKRPLTPWPAPFGSQWPEKSGFPSGRRGAGPPGGITPIAYGGPSAGCCASTGIDADASPIIAAQRNALRSVIVLSV